MSDIPGVEENMAFQIRIDRAIEELVNAVKSAPNGLTDDQRDALMAVAKS